MKPAPPVIKTSFITDSLFVLPVDRVGCLARAVGPLRSQQQKKTSVQHASQHDVFARRYDLPTTKDKAMTAVRVAIIGVGNCASSLVQGVHFYRGAKAQDQVPGLMHVDLGGYLPADIEFSAAFD